MSEFKFTRTPDRQIIGLFQEINRLGGSVSGYFLFGGGVQHDINHDFGDGIGGILNSTSCYLVRAGVNFAFAGHGGSITYDRDAGLPFVDRISFGGQFESFSDELKTEVLKIIASFLNLAPPVELATSGQTAIAQTQAILNQISSAALALTEHSAEREKSLDLARQADRARADQEVAEEKKRLHSLHEEEREQLERLRSELAAKAQELDFRENTHVRRAIHKTMSGLPKQIAQDGLLKKSANESYAITAISCLVGVGLAFAAWSSAVAFEKVSDQSAIIFLEVTRVLLGLGAGTLIWYGISNLAARNRRVAQWEQELNRFRLDVERASFLIEGDLEARKVNGEGLPPVMLEAFSRGLFANDKADHGSDDVGNALAHLLSNSAKLKFGTDGVEAEVNGKGIKKTQKELG